MTEPTLPLPPPQKDFTLVFQALRQANCTVADVVIALLTEKRFKRNTKLMELLQQAGSILKALILHSRLPKSVGEIACKATHVICMQNPISSETNKWLAL